MPDFDIEMEYKNLSKLFNLPKFSELNNEFEIHSIDKPDFVLRNLRRKMHEKVEFFSKIIESIIHPSGESIIHSYESDFFSEEEKNKLTDIHKKLLIYERKSILLDIGSSEENEAVFINNLFSEWNSIKSDLKNIMNKLISGWDNESSDSDSGGRYFG